MKLEHTIKEGIFIRKKLYCIVDLKDNVIIKSSGINSKDINYLSFKELYNGKDITTTKDKFNVIWKDLTIKITKEEIKTKGIKYTPKTYFNTYDTNIKSISIPRTTPSGSEVTKGKNIKTSYLNQGKVGYENNVNIDFNNIRKFSTTSLSLYSSKDKNEYIPILLVDDSKKETHLNHENDLYQIYDNIFLDRDFELNLVDILRNIFENHNNKHHIFKFYFFSNVNITRKTNVKYDIDKVIEHLEKYPFFIIQKEITKIYKNTALLASIPVGIIPNLSEKLSLYQVGVDMIKIINSNIKKINQEVSEDQGNTILNFNNKVNYSEEIRLVIYADYDTPLF